MTTTRPPPLPPQNSCGEHEDGADELEDALHGDAHEPERQQQQPDEGVQKKQGQGQRPAEDEEDEPKKDLHAVYPSKSLAKGGGWFLAVGYWRDWGLVVLARATKLQECTVG